MENNGTSFEMTHILNGVLGGILRVEGCEDEEIELELVEADYEKIDALTADVVRIYLGDVTNATRLAA